MIFFFRFITIFLFVISFSTVYAVRWPWIIAPLLYPIFYHVPNGGPYQEAISITCISPFSLKKTVLLSRAGIKRSLSVAPFQYLFDADVHAKKWHTFVTAMSEAVHEALHSDQRVQAKVRVLLMCCDKNGAEKWNFSAPAGFVVHAAKDKRLKNKMATQVRIQIKNGLLFCNGKRVNGSLQITPVSGHGMLNEVAYDGNFFIIPDRESFLCVNHVQLEDYITAVLKTESWPGWPLEVNKVFAIACRSYVVYQGLQARRIKRPFDVKNSNVHQTYKGRHDIAVLKEAVAQTRGLVLGFQGQPILAMFDCCCGGIIPANIADFDFKKVPYLARSYACNYCKMCSLYSWHVAYEQTSFETLIKKYNQENRLLDIRVIKKDKAGLVTDVTLQGPKKQTTISGKQLYSLLKDVKSFHFDIHKKSGFIIFTGHGFGHHLGLCQWGARQMVRDGWDFKSILRFYYPGAYFMQLM